jgi:radical SAM protein with 4Fe4S-binding SPASM domain
MHHQNPEELICRALCPYHKPDRTEEERCRGYTLLSLLLEEGRSFTPQTDTTQFDASFKRSFFYDHVCHVCPFLVDGCDFTSPDPPHDCLPCGGLILLSMLHHQKEIDESDIQRVDLLQQGAVSYVSLTPRASIKRLEEDYLYHIHSDDLYEVNEEAVDMLLQCDGSQVAQDLKPDPDFLRFCLEEDLLEFSDSPSSRPMHEGRSPVPSLRYLEWLVTFKCNLSCAHCYLGDSTSEEFPETLIRPLLDQFSTMQGLRILVSGGEPTLYSHFPVLNDALPDYPVRAVLLSNGIGVTKRMVSDLNFHEVQVSIDGMEAGHDLIRGKGSFKKAVQAMEAVASEGKALSVATMIHRGNLDELDELRDLIQDMGALEWSMDYPCVEGRWASNPDLSVDLAAAAEKMSLGFGGSYHGTSPGWMCGRHLAAVLPSGRICKCGLYQDKDYGSVQEGLAEAWMRVEHRPIHDSDCKACEHASECGGGCRFRAGGGGQKDRFMCQVYSVD